MSAVSSAASAQSWVMGYDFNNHRWYAAPAQPYPYNSPYSPYYGPYSNPYGAYRPYPYYVPRDRCDHRNDYRQRDYRRSNPYGAHNGHWDHRSRIQQKRSR